jgi:hypothetical protein
MQHYEESGGYGVLLLVMGKHFGTRRLRARSLRRFAQEVAPRLRDLNPDREMQLSTPMAAEPATVH